MRDVLLKTSTTRHILRTVPVHRTQVGATTLDAALEGTILTSKSIITLASAIVLTHTIQTAAAPRTGAITQVTKVPIKTVASAVLEVTLAVHTVLTGFLAVRTCTTFMALYSTIMETKPMLVFVVVISTPCFSVFHAHGIVFSTLFAQNIAASPIVLVLTGTSTAGILGSAVGTVVSPILVFTRTPCWSFGSGDRVVGKHTID